MRTVIWLGACATVLAQSPPPAFEAASVRHNLDGGYRFIMNATAARLNYVNVPLKWIIGNAYQVQESRVSGPDWLGAQRYDIQATYPAEGAKQVPEMLRTLLADRFKVAVHRETKDVPAYVLARGKGEPTLTNGQSGAPAGGYQMKRNGAAIGITTKATLGQLAVFLSGMLGLPVIDQTGIDGAYDLTLDWTLDESTPDRQSQMSGPLRDAVAAQLGLKLDLKKTPLEIVVVDHAEKIPTEN